MDGLKNEKYLLINEPKDECFGKKVKNQRKTCKIQTNILVFALSYDIYDYLNCMKNHSST